MELKVRAVEGNENKSKAEIEEQLLNKHEEELKQEEPQAVEETEKVVEEQPQTEDESKTPSSELNDEDVLSFLKNRYDKEINSVDELFTEKEVNEIETDLLSVWGIGPSKATSGGFGWEMLDVLNASENVNYLTLSRKNGKEQIEDKE